MVSWNRGSAAYHRRAVLLFFQLFLLPALAFAQQPDLAPDSPGAPVAEGSSVATVIGTVKDTNGNVVGGATATFTRQIPSATRTVTADSNGFFSLTLPPGRWTVRIQSAGLTPWTSTIALAAGDYQGIPDILLKVNALVSTVEVRPSEHQIAAEQLHREEQQRIAGMFPNFFVSYFPNAAALSPGQKFQLAWRSTIDPFSLVGDGVQAGYEQAVNNTPAYGQGMQGYAKRFGAAYGTDAISNLIGGAILPALFRQDPRYFYKGTGSIGSRAAYAVSTIAICKGDNGRWEPNYSYVLGNLASGAISNLYTPSSDRGWQATLGNGALTTVMGAASALLQEFVLKRISRGTPASAGPASP